VKPTRKPGTRTGTATPEAPDVLRHLADSLGTQWKRYRKRLKQCQRRFSEKAVHDSRVETRRLLALVGLLGAFLSGGDIKKVCHRLKRRLDTFDRLRDTQVQLVYVESMTGTFPAARKFHDWLKKREQRFARETERDIRRFRTKRLGRCVAGFEKQLRRRHKQMSREEALAIALREMDRAFARVARLCRNVKADDTRTIHCTRIAFKRFRYQAESLAPLLPAITGDHCRAMRGYQSMMGDIQDVEVLLATLRKFRKEKQPAGKSVPQLQAELSRRRRWLIQVYLNAAGKLRGFWPPHMECGGKA